MITKHHLITSLIKDDLVHIRLVEGLNKLGLDASPYFLRLSDTVFALMDFEENDRVYELYLELTAKAKDLDVTESLEDLEAWAQFIYTRLLEETKGSPIVNSPQKSPVKGFFAGSKG